MSIATQITRLQNIKANSRNALVTQGITSASTHNMEDFPTDILAIQTSAYAYIIATYPSGATCECVNGSTTLTAKDTSGLAVFEIPRSGTWTVMATSGSNTATASVSITAQWKIESIRLSFRMPFEYQEVEFLGCDGTQSILTTALVGNSSYVESKMNCIGNNTTGSYFTSPFGANKNYALPRQYYGYVYYARTYQGGYATNQTQKNIIFSLEYIDGGVAATYTPVDGGDAVVKTNTFTKRTATNEVITLCGHGDVDGTKTPATFDNKFRGKIWYIKTKTSSSDTTLTHDFIPVYRKSDNKPGFWDAIDKVFYENMSGGSTDFVVGPDVASM